jgi:hypothetical protein
MRTRLTVMTSRPPRESSPLTVPTCSSVPDGPFPATSDSTASSAPLVAGTHVTVGSGVPLTLCACACTWPWMSATS